MFPDSWLDHKFSYKFVINGSKWVTSSQYPIERDSRGLENNVLTVTPQYLPVVPPGVYETIQVPRGYLNALHTQMAIEGFSELFVSMESEEAMVVVRQNPTTMESYVLVARSYYRPNVAVTSLKPVKLPGIVSGVELISQLSIRDWNFVQDRNEVNGYKGWLECYGNLTKFASISRS